MTENVASDKVERKINLLGQLGELYDEAEKLLDQAFQLAYRANQDTATQTELYRELSRRSGVALDMLKRVGAMAGEALLAVSAEAKKKVSDGS